MTRSLLFLALSACVARDQFIPPDEPDPPIDPPPPPADFCAGVDPDPGRVALRRLNRIELDNTARDLIGADTDFSAGLPEETIGYGFDNIGEVQSLSPLEVELYADAAEAITTGPLLQPQNPIDETYQAEALQGTNGTAPIGAPDGATYFFNTIGWIASRSYAFAPGNYRIVIRAYGEAENVIDPPEMYVTVGSQISDTVAVSAVASAPGTYTVNARIEGEVGEVRIGFSNPYYQPVHVPLYSPPTSCITNEDDDTECSTNGTGNTCKANMCRVFTPCQSDAECSAGLFCGAGDGCGTRRTCCLDPNPQRRFLWVDSFQILGPLGREPEQNPLRDAIVDCDAEALGIDACARRIVESFGRRAWRRPLDPTEVDGLVALVQLAIDEGDRFDDGIDLALRAILSSPSFLFRVETDPDPTSIVPHALSDHELAVRLSYFLWSTTPDAELSALADQGRLHEDAILAAQIERMLTDPRAHQLTGNFGDQWLQIRSMDQLHPSENVFPEFDQELAAAMKSEAQLFFGTFLERDRRIEELLTAKDTFANDRLAAHYGLPPIQGSELVPVSLEGTPRTGFITQGGLLTLTSNADRTSVVQRGKWILEQMLCVHLDPPPANVEGFEEDVDPTAPLRERMAQHRANPVCAGCHSAMDPIGFAMESFDGIGRHRTEDEFGNPIDATGELPDGRTFDGAEEMGAVLASDPLFFSCATRNMTTYAVGRGFTTAEDRCAIDALAAGWSAEDHRFTGLVRRVITSELFRSRRGGEP